MSDLSFKVYRVTKTECVIRKRGHYSYRTDNPITVTVGWGCGGKLLIKYSVLDWFEDDAEALSGFAKAKRKAMAITAGEQKHGQAN